MLEASEKKSKVGVVVTEERGGWWAQREAGLGLVTPIQRFIHSTSMY